MQSYDHQDPTGMSCGAVNHGSADSWNTPPTRLDHPEGCYQLSDVPAPPDEMFSTLDTSGLDLLATAVTMVGMPTGQGNGTAGVESSSDADQLSSELRSFNRLYSSCRMSPSEIDSSHDEGPDRKRRRTSSADGDAPLTEKVEESDDGSDEEEGEMDAEGGCDSDEMDELSDSGDDDVLDGYDDDYEEEDGDDDDDDDSSTDTETDSSSDSSDDESSDDDDVAVSDTASGSDDEADVIPCPDSCICQTGQRGNSIPEMKRRYPTIQPLLEKLLICQTLDAKKLMRSSCCRAQCFLEWERISPYSLESDYDPSDLQMMRFSWGDWKLGMDKADDDSDSSDSETESDSSDSETESDSSSSETDSASEESDEDVAGLDALADSDDDADDFACPDTCVCQYGVTRKPIPKKERRFRTIQPLREKLLRRQTLDPAKVFMSVCCRNHCCWRWERISARRMVSHYHRSDLNVMHFRWGVWKLV